MTTYLYETIPASADEPVETFEIRQSMKDPALTTHPETGKPVRRVITGGFGTLQKSAPPVPQTASTGHSCCGGCCCH